MERATGPPGQVRMTTWRHLLLFPSIPWSAIFLYLSALCGIISSFSISLFPLLPVLFFIPPCMATPHSSFLFSVPNLSLMTRRFARLLLPSFCLYLEICNYDLFVILLRRNLSWWLRTSVLHLAAGNLGSEHQVLRHASNPPPSPDLWAAISMEKRQLVNRILSNCFDCSLRWESWQNQFNVFYN